MPLRIVIPSYKRADRVVSKKLVNDPIICVAKSESDVYRDLNPDCEIVSHPDSIKGLIPKRNWMVKHFHELFMLDDDVFCFRKMYIEAGESLTIHDKSDITRHIFELYDLANTLDIHLFGFSKIQRPVFFNEFSWFSLNVPITGCAYGVIGNDHTVWNEDLTLKEDFWISCYVKYYERKILVDNRYNFSQKDTFVNPGGLSQYRNEKTEKENMLAMKKYFGDCVQLKNTENQTQVKSKVKYNITVSFPL